MSGRFFHRCVAHVAASKPILGRRPKSEIEWAELLKTYEQLLRWMLCNMGLSSKRASEIANSIFAGPAGQMLLELALSEKPHE